MIEIGTDLLIFQPCDVKENTDWCDLSTFNYKTGDIRDAINKFDNIIFVDDKIFMALRSKDIILASIGIIQDRIYYLANYSRFLYILYYMKNNNVNEETALKEMRRYFKI